MSPAREGQPDRREGWAGGAAGEEGRKLRTGGDDGLLGPGHGGDVARQELLALDDRPAAAAVDVHHVLGLARLAHLAQGLEVLHPLKYTENECGRVRCVRCVRCACAVVCAVGGVPW